MPGRCSGRSPSFKPSRWGMQAVVGETSCICTGVSTNRGPVFWGPYMRDRILSGSMPGAPDCWKLAYGYGPSLNILESCENIRASASDNVTD